VKKTSVPAFKPGTGFKSYVASSKRDQAAFRKARG
jgi:DNA-binding protein HU-beta